MKYPTLSTVTCPHCGHAQTVRIPEDACLWQLPCPGCGAVLQAQPGDCCVLCSYGDVPCLVVQQRNAAAPGTEGWVVGR